MYISYVVDIHDLIYIINVIDIIIKPDTSCTALEPIRRRIWFFSAFHMDRSLLLLSQPHRHFPPQ